MLTSSASQYLHPGDYLQPLPTTLDAKKSPLALLAQTCSSIGKDTGPSKPIIPPIEKKDVQKEGRKTESPGAKSTASSEGRKSQGERKEGAGSPSSRDGGNKSSFRTPPPKDIPPLVPITSKADGQKTPTSSSDSSSSAKPSTSSPSSSLSSSTNPTASSGQNSNSRISLNCGSLSLEVNHQESTSHSLSRTSLPPSLHGSSLKHDNLSAAHSLFPHSYGGLPFFGHPSLDMAHYSSLAAHSALLAAAHHKPGMSPYVKYATVKTSTGATTLVPVCSDPYCTHCKLTLSSAQLNPHSPSAGACGAGCTQCSHDKPSLPPPPPPTSLSLGLPGFSHGLSSSSALSSLYPHQPFGVLPGHHGLPYICNWVAGSDYCGKRFSTSEELLQHLRTHTSSSDAAAASLGLQYSSLGLSASALAASHSHLSSAGSLSPNSALRQAAASSYPRSMSPNSILAAARYHPYSKSPLSSLPTPGSSLANLPPSLGAYYPYAALYSQRLGAVP